MQRKYHPRASSISCRHGGREGGKWGRCSGEGGAQTIMATQCVVHGQKLCSVGHTAAVALPQWQHVGTPHLEGRACGSAALGDGTVRDSNKIATPSVHESALHQVDRECLLPALSVVTVYDVIHCHRMCLAASQATTAIPLAFLLCCTDCTPCSRSMCPSAEHSTRRSVRGISTGHMLCASRLGQHITVQSPHAPSGAYERMLIPLSLSK